jgi:hypothetical protein
MGFDARSKLPLEIGRPQNVTTFQIALGPAPALILTRVMKRSSVQAG